MHYSFIIIHVCLMCSSLLITIAACLLTAFGKSISARIMTVNVALTVAGIASGLALLAVQPVGSRCALLASYLVGFGIAYRFIRANQPKAASYQSK